jgi:tetratricopeptide (TPR) repeat protein
VPTVLDDAERLLEEARTARAASNFLLLEKLGRGLIALGERDSRIALRADGYYFLGLALTNLNRTSEAIRATKSALALYDEAGDRLAVARATQNLGTIAIDNENDVSTARQLFDASLPAIRELGAPINLAISLGNLSEICRLEGDYKGALSRAQEALSIFRQLGEPANIAWVLSDIAHYHLLLRQTPEAIASMIEAFAPLVQSENPRWFAWYFDVWFLIAARLGHLDLAAKLLGFTDKYRDAENQPRSQAMLPWFSEPRERLVRELGAARVDELYEAGEALTIDTAYALAIERLST